MTSRQLERMLEKAVAEALGVEIPHRRARKADRPSSAPTQRHQAKATRQRELEPA
jgi:hypothetical protein